jgi:hypothetical protein
LDLTEFGAQSLRFASRAHDFPGRVADRRDAVALVARIDDGSDTGQRLS